MKGWKSVVVDRHEQRNRKGNQSRPGSMEGESVVVIVGSN